MRGGSSPAQRRPCLARAVVALFLCGGLGARFFAEGLFGQVATVGNANGPVDRFAGGCVVLGSASGAGGLDAACSVIEAVREESALVEAEEAARGCSAFLEGRRREMARMAKHSTVGFASLGFGGGAFQNDAPFGVVPNAVTKFGIRFFPSAPCGRPALDAVADVPRFAAHGFGGASGSSGVNWYM